MNTIKHRLFMIGIWSLAYVAAFLYYLGATIQTLGDFVFNYGDSLRDFVQAILIEARK